jgi:hypothetical protein
LKPSAFVRDGEPQSNCEANLPVFGAKTCGIKAPPKCAEKILVGLGTDTRRCRSGLSAEPFSLKSVLAGQ